MFTKTEALRPNLDVRSAEMMADTLRHIGADLFSKKDYPLAIKWLKRAYDIFNSQDIGIMSMEGLESRTAICHSLIRSLLGVGSPESINEADSLVAYVESEIGDKPVVLHWRLEILQTWPGETFDIGKYSSILRRMIRMFEPSAKSFDFLLHHIKELRKKSSKLAIALIDEFLTQQLLKLANKEWLSKAVVTRIWMSTVEGDLAEPDGSNLLTGVLDTVSDAVQEPLSPDAAGAAHSVSIPSDLSMKETTLRTRAHMEKSRSRDHESTARNSRYLVFDCTPRNLLQLRGRKPSQIWEKTASMCLESE